MTKENPKEIGIKVMRGEEEIPVEELTVILNFDGNEEVVELKNTVVRSMMLAQENFILKQAMAQIRDEITRKSIITQPGPHPQRFYEGK